jgi:hypothetical protein
LSRPKRVKDQSSQFTFLSCEKAIRCRREFHNEILWWWCVKFRGNSENLIFDDILISKKKMKIRGKMYEIDQLQFVIWWMKNNKKSVFLSHERLFWWNHDLGKKIFSRLLAVVVIILSYSQMPWFFSNFHLRKFQFKTIIQKSATSVNSLMSRLGVCILTGLYSPVWSINFLGHHFDALFLLFKF